MQHIVELIMITRKYFPEVCNISTAAGPGPPERVGRGIVRLLSISEYSWQVTGRDIRYEFAIPLHAVRPEDSADIVLASRARRFLSGKTDRFILVFASMV